MGANGIFGSVSASRIDRLIEQAIHTLNAYEKLADQMTTTMEVTELVQRKALQELDDLK